MADYDLVKWDLSKELKDLEPDWDQPMAPIPMPEDSAGVAAELSASTAPPSPSLVGDEARVQAPYRSVGRFLAKFHELGHGSGWVVAQRAFITAGHCVYRPQYDGWITAALFVPRYHKELKSAYKVETIFTLEGWYNDQKRAYDMAVCVVTKNFDLDKEPPLAFKAESPYLLEFKAIGYPGRTEGEYDFNGERMWDCDGESLNSADGVQWMACNFTNGASGGPWWDSTNGYVAGLSAGRNKSQEQLSSPDFGNDKGKGLENLYKEVKDL
jgi:V8-like Glu-specific endopeptidase